MRKNKVPSFSVPEWHTKFLPGISHNLNLSYACSTAVSNNGRLTLSVLAFEGCHKVYSYFFMIGAGVMSAPLPTTDLREMNGALLFRADGRHSTGNGNCSMLCRSAASLHGAVSAHAKYSFY